MCDEEEEVAAILVELGLDTAAIVTALLHDTIEDTKLTLFINLFISNKSSHIIISSLNTFIPFQL